MGVERYDIIDDPEAECSECGAKEDLVNDDDKVICTDCLFEKKTEEIMKDYLDYHDIEEDLGF